MLNVPLHFKKFQHFLANRTMNIFLSLIVNYCYKLSVYFYIYIFFSLAKIALHKTYEGMRMKGRVR